MHDIKDSKEINPKTEGKGEHREFHKKVPSLNLKRKLKYNDDSEDEKRQITEHTLIEKKVLDDKKGKETNKDPTLSEGKGYMNNALGDKTKDDPKIQII